jgi:tRNA nucleotidyltransferase (CCA-adding enzyme)
LRAPALLALLEGCDAFRRPSRLEALLRACEAETFGERGWVDVSGGGRRSLGAALGAALGVDVGAIARRSAKLKIAANIHAARQAAIEGVIEAPTEAAIDTKAPAAHAGAQRR